VGFEGGETGAADAAANHFQAAGIRTGPVDVPLEAMTLRAQELGPGFQVNPCGSVTRDLIGGAAVARSPPLTVPDARDYGVGPILHSSS
jgi:hypothetical protein